MTGFTLIVFAATALVMAEGTEPGQMVRLRVELSAEQGLIDNANKIQKVARLEALERVWERRQRKLARQEQEAEDRIDGIIGPVRIRVLERIDKIDLSGPPVGVHKPGGGRMDDFGIVPARPVMRLDAAAIERIRELQQQMMRGDRQRDTKPGGG